LLADPFGTFFDKYSHWNLSKNQDTHLNGFNHLSARTTITLYIKKKTHPYFRRGMSRVAMQVPTLDCV